MNDLRLLLTRRLFSRNEKPVWRWAEENLVFSSRYPTARKGKYDSSLVPFWREPQEAITDPAIREIIVLKAGQAGGTENLLLNAIRHSIVENPLPTLYVSGQQELTEAFLEERIKPALEDCALTRPHYRAARIRGNEVYFPTMLLACTWASSVMGLKSRPIGLILCDELSTWPSNSLDKVRIRAATYPFSHVVVVSTPDSEAGRTSEDDPIFVEFAATDQRYFMLPDKDGSRFRFLMGSPETPWGLKWDEKAKRKDGEWDYDKVRATAHYVSPAGMIINDRKKYDLIQKGKWVPLRPDMERADKRGYHLNALYLPWRSFGSIAVAFLEAKKKGKEYLKVFIYEYLAEPWIEERTIITHEALKKCSDKSYGRGKRFSDTEAGKAYSENKQPIVFLTVDVQKFGFYWVAREWLLGGDSFLIDAGYCQGWDDLIVVADKYQSPHVLVDAGYGERATEVYEACFRYHLIPCKGASTRMTITWQKSTINVFEGTRRQSSRLAVELILHDTITLKNQLAARIFGESTLAWRFPADIPGEYIAQIMSEEFLNGKWLKRRTARENHYWDCEVLQMLAATIYGYAYKLIDPNKNDGK